MLYLTATEIITSLLIFLGVFLTFLSAVGVMRFPDVYSRMHAAGKSSTLGVVFLMLAVVVYFIPNGGINIKILLAIVFVFITAPLSSLMITRSAYRTGVRLEKNHVQDDLKKVKTKENNK
ncbi:monovalent cation/H(+) antiporter subunit G [Enterococcus saccharolyticus]|uniref:monovalent cation/H(+) antiporter subunit G n=1 Tax=Enterococcus saccharolyticus TaxID=41997 RepID=UPI001FE166DE|nr:monovalent cation/H(+) antiporter subunit G [Enterococcus saccharolyticus]